MKNTIKSIIIIILISSFPLFSTQKFETCKERAEYYQKLYGKLCTSEKITDNFGNGNELLYGTRNMRTVLYGIAYRGGANNFYHKTDKRDNSNPLPNDGLMNLSNQGFSKAIYLYDKNFDSAPKEIINPTIDDTLEYIKLSGTDRKTVRKIMLLVLETITNPSNGPIYLHCWNGWHQSGYISSAILMQFCNLTNDQALEYWIKNTDKNHKGYDHVKKLVKSFEKFDDIKIDKATKALICPCMK
jgi:hypothetical protein